MSGLSDRDWKELQKLQQKSGYSTLSQPEQRRLEHLEGLQRVERNKDILRNFELSFYR